MRTSKKIDLFPIPNIFKSFKRACIFLSLIHVFFVGNLHASTEQYQIRVIFDDKVSNWLPAESFFHPWKDIGSSFNCGEWYPEEISVKYDETFIKNRICQKNISRDVETRVYNSFSGEIKIISTSQEGKIISENESQTAKGKKDYIVSEKEGEWESWINNGEPENCNEWLPLAADVNHGSIFEQSRTCSQNQISTRKIINIWFSGLETIKSTESKAKNTSVVEKKENTGTKPILKWTANGLMNHTVSRKTTYTNGETEYEYFGYLGKGNLSDIGQSCSTLYDKRSYGELSCKTSASNLSSGRTEIHVCTFTYMMCQ